jgi:hypothetical protein
MVAEARSVMVVMVLGRGLGFEHGWRGWLLDRLRLGRDRSFAAAALGFARLARRWLLARFDHVTGCGRRLVRSGLARRCGRGTRGLVRLVIHRRLRVGSGDMELVVLGAGRGRVIVLSVIASRKRQCEDERQETVEWKHCRSSRRASLRGITRSTQAARSDQSSARSPNSWDRYPDANARSHARVSTAAGAKAPSNR